MTELDDAEPSRLALPYESWRLWVGDAPGRPERLPTPTLFPNRERQDRPEWAQGIAQPELLVFRPPHPNGTGALIIPGGGFAFLSFCGEGSDVAQRLMEADITCFVLIHRLPRDGWADPARTPLQDAQRAMRVIRSFPESFNITPDRLGVVGFSAGGHVAAMLATAHDDPTYRAADSADLLSARPSFCGLIYPAIAMRPPTANLACSVNLLGTAPTESEIDANSPARRVSATTPPCFLLHAMDDGVVPVDNSLAMLFALHKNGIKTEAHIFQEGGHGFGLALPDAMPASRWPVLFIQWVDRVLIQI